MSKTNDQLSQEEIENDIPDMQKQRAGNSSLQMIGAIVIVCIGVGSLLFMAMSSANKEEKDVQQEKIENTLPALVVQPSKLNYSPQVPAIKTVEKERFEPVKKPIFVRPVKQQPKQASYAKKEEKLTPWYDRKKDAGFLEAEAGELKNYPQETDPEMNGFMLGGSPEHNSTTDLESKLSGSNATMAVAAMLPNRNYLIAQGTSLDCSLETALDSSLSGLTTCILSRDVYSDNGRVLLLDRGSKLTGEYTGGLKNGQKRLFVLWTRAKTPNGVVIALNSPSADGLGRSGMSGWVDTHFMARFGTAIFLSIIKDSIQTYQASQVDAQGSVIIGNTAESGEKVVEKVLDATANIPPTLVKNQGETIKVMVARDLDFSTVYDLKVKN